MRDYRETMKGFFGCRLRLGKFGPPAGRLQWVFEACQWHLGQHPRFRLPLVVRLPSWLLEKACFFTSQIMSAVQLRIPTSLGALYKEIVEHGPEWVAVEEISSVERPTPSPSNAETAKQAQRLDESYSPGQLNCAKIWAIRHLRHGRISPASRIARSQGTHNLFPLLGRLVGD
jgi:hypothetical protein